MVTRIEAGHSPDQLFDQTRLAIKTHLLRSTLIPQKYKLEVADLLDRRTQMLDEVAFSAKAREASITSNAVDKEEQLVQQLAGVRAMHLHREFTGDKDQIIIRERTVEQLIDRPNELMGGMLEEVAHAFHKHQNPEMISTEHERSLKIYPASTLGEFESMLQQYRTEVNIPGQVNLENVVLIPSGHTTYIQEQVPDDENKIIYPVSYHQYAFEEARALVTQSIFASTVLGSKKKPYGSLREQLYTGMEDLIERAKEDEDIESKQMRGLQTILPLFEQDPKFADAAREFIGKAYELDVDQFMDYLQRKNTRVCANYLSLIQDFCEGLSQNSIL